ncbi:MAG TPA: helix-turn-helix transcriptional regulator [Ktedonobacteraceae bacterium]|nr:helix-turn-helix transcriptional regulator [Ktedonobacteraceae bacterium]
MSRATKTHAERSCLFAAAMERLEQFEPMAMHAVAHDAQSYALAYVEHYQGNVPQLEREREFLLAALAQAWEQEKYTTVVRLMIGLAYLAGRLGNDAEGQRILLWSIEACRRTHDRYHLATFLNRLSGLLWSHGKYVNAWQVWEEGRTIAVELGHPACLWEPLFSLVYIADILGANKQVQRFADTLLHAEAIDDASSIAAALFIRAFFARFAGDKDRAYNDLSSCVQPLSLKGASQPEYRQFFELEVQTELARVEGNYTRSQECAESAISLAQTFCDPYTIAILLIDHAFFAYQQGVLSEAYASIQYLAKLTRYMGAPHLHNATLFYLQHLPEATRFSIQRGEVKSGPKSISSAPHVLSPRELEILQLVAAGLSNQEIAARLVITSGTTKKHLEHIYAKLDARSRTQAIARARVIGVLA